METPTENDRQPDNRAGCAVADGSAFLRELGDAMDRALLPPKLCVDCEHHKGYRLKGEAQDRHVCLMRLYEVKIDPVTGDRRERHTNCRLMRKHSNLCGHDARFFSPLNNKISNSDPSK